ncbi:SF0329 family protein [Jeotgalibaca sp. A127]|uniref:SF0329 family protein n=1 Tax=Jeotgalibaca sp. A127 TaxID=3457324 RepID=UPI003FD6667E
MNWSKMKQQLEGFLYPALAGRVAYIATSYRYTPEKAGQCYLTVDKKKVFNMKDATTGIRWFQSEQEIKGDSNLNIPVSQDDIEKVRKDMGEKVPEERLVVIAKDRKLQSYAKEMIAAQTALSKADFNTVANTFLTRSIEESLASQDILLNVLALVDRRVGKKRILDMENKMKLKHPIVQYFYKLRRNAL